MKIAHRLFALSAFCAAGLLCVAAVSYVAVTSIQADLQGLTQRAGPLQARTLELQERTERLLGALFRLSLMHNSDEASKASTAIHSDMQSIDRLHADIRALDPKTQGDSAEFRRANEQIARAVQQRLGDEAAYRGESESARLALKKAEEAVTVTRHAVASIGTEAGQAADKAQDALRRVGQVIKLALVAQTRLKEVALVVADVDAVTNRFRLTPLKERFKATLDSIQRLEVDPGADDPLKELRQLSARQWELVQRDNDGLLALRAKALAKQDGAEAAYTAGRKALLGPLEEQGSKLGALVDGLEVQAVKQRQTLEAALRLRNEPGGVVASSEEVALGIRDMVAGLRLLMLADNEKDAAASQTQLQQQTERLTGSMKSMRAGLQKMNRPALVQQVDQALAAMAAVATSVAKVAQSKHSVLASQAQMAQSMAQLKSVAAQQASVGQQQVKGVAERQVAVTQAVDARVQSSLLVILGIAAAITAVIAGLSWVTVRAIIRRLDAAVQVAEQVSQGQLVSVDVGLAGHDEMTRLMAALQRMVGTLRGIVGNIREASELIDVGSSEISRGNHDLSLRTEQQAAQLQQTASAVEELSVTIRNNATSARDANEVACQAREVAESGGQRVGEVVSTMQGIQEASQHIADIVGVIDGIAFQTNILALNAAVEAARAGSQGRGFAVVASEVRSLASKSAEAARQIKSIVQANVDRVAVGARQVKHAGDTMQGIVDQVQRVTALIADIASASQQQAASVSSVGSSMNQIDEMTQRNAALAEQGTAAALTLRAQAESLVRAVSVFAPLRSA